MRPAEVPERVVTPMEEAVCGLANTLLDEGPPADEEFDTPEGEWRVSARMVADQYLQLIGRVYGIDARVRGASSDD